MKKKLTSGGKKRSRSVNMPPTVGYRPHANSGRESRRSRQCLRPWMEALLDSKKCPILRWVDKNSKQFSIAWRHASSNGFDARKHGDLFFRWAEHTGKVGQNIDVNHSNIKSRFRCALNSLPDCIQLTKDGEKKGEEAKRTYMFISPDHPNYGMKRNGQRRRKSKVPLKEESPNLSPDSAEVDTSLKAEQVQDTLKTEQDEGYWESETWTEVVSPAFDDQPQSSSNTQFIVMEDVVLTGESSTVTSETGDMNMPVGLSGGLLSEPCVPNLDDLLEQTPNVTNTRIVTQLQRNGVICVELCNSEYREDVVTQQPEAEAENNFLPTFSELGVSESDEIPIYHPTLNSGGSVKIQTTKPMALSQPEYVIDPVLLQRLLDENSFMMNAETMDDLQDLDTLPDLDFDDSVLGQYMMQ